MGTDRVNFTIREARKDDVAAIVALSAHTLADHRARFPDHFIEQEPPAKQFLEDLFSGRTKGLALAADENGTVIGWAGLAMIDIPSSAGMRDILGLFIDLTVAETARGNQVGTALLNEVVERSAGLGVTILRGDVWLGTQSSGVLGRAGIVPVKTVHERRLAKRLTSRNWANQLYSLANRLLPILTALLAAILFFELFRR